MSSADPAPPDPDRPTADPAEPAPSYARLGDALSRALAPRRWWRHRLLRSAGTGRLRSGVLPVLAALAAVLILSLLGITAPWNSDPDPARGGGALDSDDSVLVSPPAPPAAPPSLSSRLEPVQNSPTLAACPRALSVAVSADIATLVQELAGPLTGGTCPQVSVSSQGPAGMAGPLTYQGGAPDAEVWIPASSLSLRLAGSTTFPSTGTSIARSPIVIALPKPVADSLTGFPVWILIYNELTAADGEIQRMSMPDHRTTVGALAQVTLQQALLQLAEGNKNNAFVHLIAFRNSVATTQADVGELLDRMARTSPARAGAEVGVFPATEQQLVAYHKRDPATPIAPMGTYDANIEADYPMVVSRSLDGRLAGIADELRAALRSPAAVQRLVEAGFRPADDPGLRSSSGFPAGYPNPFPLDVDYPPPVPLPDAAKWRSIVDGWTWQG